MRKKLPKLDSDAEAEAFVDKTSLTEFDLSEMRKLRLEVHPSPRGEEDAPDQAKRGRSARRVGR